jgi:hypothetical protein
MAEARVQRRLAAILSADVVGYSRLMGIDETGTLARLKAVRRDIVDPLIATEAVWKRSRANNAENYFLYYPFTDRGHSAIRL